MSTQAKLTLRLDQALIEQTKKIAAKKKRSLSQLVADYFKLLENKSSHKNRHQIAITPLVQALSGCLKNNIIDAKDYYEHLEDKYL